MLETLLHNNNLSQPLLLTDLPKMVRIFEIQYELQYSESYVGNYSGRRHRVKKIGTQYWKIAALKLSPVGRG